MTGGSRSSFSLIPFVRARGDRFRSARALALGLGAAAALAVGGDARAFIDDVGSRAVAMGGAGRADALGEEAPLLNPSGMALARLYTVQGHYQFTSGGGAQLAHVSVVDSTSAFNLSGGAYYTYRTTSASASFTHQTGHEGGASLALPIGDTLMVGFTGKYVHLDGGAPVAGGGGSTLRSGLTLDAGITLRPSAFLTIGVVGYNLRDLSTPLAPLSLGYGVAVSPIPDLTIALDAFHDFTTYDDSRGVRTTLAAGVDYGWNQKVAFRAGGGRDGSRGNGFLAAGFATISDLGAVDLSARQDVSGESKLTTFIVSLRLFVPQP